MLEESHVAKKSKNIISANKSLNSDVYELISDDELDGKSSSSSSKAGCRGKGSDNPDVTKNKYFQSGMKGSYVDKKFDLTPCLDKMIDFILDVIADSQESKGFGQADLVLVWKSLTDGENGKRIEALLRAAVLPAEIGLLNVNNLQKKT